MARWLAGMGAALGLCALGQAAGTPGASTNSVAQSYYQTGLTAQRQGNRSKAVESFRKAIEIDHDFIDGNLAYIQAATGDIERPEGDGPWGVKDSKLLAMYQKWSDSDPSLLWTYTLALGLTLINNPGAVEHALVQACTSKPALEPYLLQMAADRVVRDPQQALSLIVGLSACDKDAYLTQLRQIAARYPKQPVALKALSLLQAQAATTKDKIAGLEQIRLAFSRFGSHDDSALRFDHRDDPPAKYNELMWELYELRFRAKDWQKAADLANQMSQSNPGDGMWSSASAFLKSMNKPIQNMNDGLGPFAAHYIPVAQLQIGLIDMAAGRSLVVDPRSAYQSALRLAVESNGAEIIQGPLRDLGQFILKTPASVDRDIWQMRTKDAKAFKPFVLQTYEGKTISLRELRGQVVLVSFWFPTCVGCVAEFPFFEQLHEKYAKTGRFTLMVINIIPAQDADAPKLWARKHYTFTSLRVPDAQWAKRSYGIESAPTNFLLDARGRIIGNPMIHDAPEMEQTQRQIEELIEHATVDRGSG